MFLGSKVGELISQKKFVVFTCRPGKVFLICNLGGDSGVKEILGWVEEDYKNKSQRRKAAWFKKLLKKRSAESWMWEKRHCLAQTPSQSPPTALVEGSYTTPSRG